MWPSTLQNAGFAGTTRAAGVGARSATASGEAACRVAESICTAPDAAPAMPPQVAVGSPTIFAAGDGETAARTARKPPTDIAAREPNRAIVSTQFIVSARARSHAHSMPAHHGRQ